MIILVAVAVALGYLTGFAVTTRRRYTATRPFTEPLNCREFLQCKRGDHSEFCYRRNKDTTISSATEALVFALLLASIWPLALLGFGALALGRLIAGGRELPAEREARTARLEREAGIGDEP